MPIVKANTDDLFQQALIHQKLAAFYRHAYEQIVNQGSAVAHTLANAQRYNDADQYRQWISTLSHLQEEANAHDAWANYFIHYAEQLQAVEAALAGDNGAASRFRAGSHWVE